MKSDKEILTSINSLIDILFHYAGGTIGDLKMLDESLNNDITIERSVECRKVVATCLELYAFLRKFSKKDKNKYWAIKNFEDNYLSYCKKLCEVTNEN